MSMTPTWPIILNGFVFIVVILFGLRSTLRVVRAPGVTRAASIYAKCEFAAGAAWLGIAYVAALASERSLISSNTAIAVIGGTFLIVAAVCALLRRNYPDDGRPTERL